MRECFITQEILFIIKKYENKNDDHGLGGRNDAVGRNGAGATL
jgi:hypothetical protein